MVHIFEEGYYRHPVISSKSNLFENLVIMDHYFKVISQTGLRTEENLDKALNIFKFLTDSEVVETEIKIEKHLEAEGVSREKGQRLDSKIFSNLSSRGLKGLTDILINSASKYVENISGIEEDDLYNKFENIKKIFKLSLLERDYLVSIYLFETNKFYKDFLNNFSEGATIQKGNSILQSSIISFEFKSILFNADTSSIKRVIQKQSPLIKYQLLDEYKHLQSPIIDYLLYSEDKPFSSIHYDEIEDYFDLKVSDFSYLKKEVDFALTLFNSNNSNGLKILLYGKGGTGKSSFAKVLIKELNYKGYILKNIDEEDEDKDDKLKEIGGLYCFEREVNLGDKVIIIDEAEEILSTKRGYFGTPSPMKKPVNTFLDESKSNQIWIVNSINNIDETTLRRFNYSIRFNELTSNERRSIWEKHLIMNGYKTEEYRKSIDFLGNKYAVSPGIISKCVENYTLLNSNESSVLLSSSQETISSYLKLNNLESTIPHNTSNKLNYSISAISTKSDTKEIIESVKSFYELDDFTRKIIKNINIVLYGVPGSGKSEFARYIGEEVNKQVLSVSAKDLLSKWVGEDIKNVSNIFTEAMERDMILHLDEVDTLIPNRDGASQSWRVDVVNQFLQSMESFSGVFIATTNRIDSIDEAALRRFSHKVEFGYLEQNSIENLYNLYFRDYLIDDEQLEKLLQLKSLTPGDFKSVFNRVALRKDRVSSSYIVELLMEEEGFKSKKRSIGFR